MTHDERRVQALLRPRTGLVEVQPLRAPLRATGAAGPSRDRPLVKTDLAPRLASEKEGRP